MQPLIFKGGTAYENDNNSIGFGFWHHGLLGKYRRRIAYARRQLRERQRRRALRCGLSHSRTLWHSLHPFKAEDGLQRKVLDHMTFHEKDGFRHEFLPTPEYVYNALPFFFPPQNATGIKAVDISKKGAANKSYGIDGRQFAGQGIAIENGKKILARHYE